MSHEQFQALSEMLTKHQWAGSAHGMYNIVRCCPECQGIHPDDSLKNGRGKYYRGNGHKPGCAIVAALAPAF